MKIEKIKKMLLAPARVMRPSYVPLLMIYFAYGATALSSIPAMYWVKDTLGFSATALAAVSVWLSVPWTIKMIFGQLIDSVNVWGSNRTSYVCIAAVFMFIGILLLAGLAGDWVFVLALGEKINIYLLAYLVLTIGLVLQDVVADAMTAEVVSREGKSREEVEKELSEVQLLGRLALYLALFVCIPIGVYINRLFGYEVMFLTMLLIPLISILGVVLIPKKQMALEPINYIVLVGGLFYAGITIGLGFFNIPFGQEIIFVISFIVIIFLIRNVAGNMPQEKIQGLIAVAIVVFVFRAMPSAGAGVTWWEIDVLHFDQDFFTVLSQTGNGIAILGMLLGIKLITEKPVGWVLGWVTVIGFVLSVPTVAMYYGFHEWTTAHFGFGARTIALIDTAASSPFDQFSMIPVLALVAYYAVRGKEATWFALAASFMNLSLTAGSILTKYLTQIFVVTQAQYDTAHHLVAPADYSELGGLMIVSCLVGLVVPLLAIWKFANPKIKVE